MKGPFRFRVNGEDLQTDREVLTVEEILRKAGTGAGVDPEDVASYFLENLRDGRKYEALSDKVTIKDGFEFVAVHAGATPVA